MKDKVSQLWTWIKPFKGAFILALLLTTVLSFIGMIPPLLMRRLVNNVAKEGEWNLFPLIMVVLIAIPILRSGINLVHAFAVNKVGIGLLGSMRKRLYAHLMRLSMDFYEETPPGNINQRLVGDVGAVSGFVTGGLVNLVADVVSVVFALIVMFRISPLLLGLSLFLLPLYVLNYFFFSRRIAETNVTLRNHMDHISSFLQERLSAHELMRSYGQEKPQSTHFNSQSKQIMDNALRSGAYNAAFSHIGAFINRIGNTTIFCAGCYLLIRGRMGYGDVMAFGAYTTSLLGPLVRFSTVANQFRQVGVSVDRINQVLHKKPGITEASDPVPLTGLQGDIKFSEVDFRHGEPEPALDNVSLEIPAGSSVAVAGLPGAGRTTLALLLRRFYDPTDGTISVDNVDIKKYKLHDYRKSLALVLPESAIFDGTIRENMLYGAPGAGDERMREIAHLLSLDEFTEELRDGYETRVGSGGLRLPAGICQKIGIARALLSDPDVLITDEATSRLDGDSAEAVISAILEAMEDRTCLMVVNRVLHARETDSVVVLQNGSVQEIGEHETLLRKQEGHYRYLFEQQYGQQAPPLDSTETTNETG
ncbi:MAG: ABC transporter ATP-binding protein [Candidatus Brocadiia bacterium]